MDSPSAADKRDDYRDDQGPVPLDPVVDLVLARQDGQDSGHGIRQADRLEEEPLIPDLLHGR
jgi:hypothetical protein